MSQRPLFAAVLVAACLGLPFSILTAGEEGDDEAGSASEPRPAAESDEGDDADEKDAESAEAAPGISRRLQIERALRQPTQLQFTETPLGDVLTFLSNYHEIPVWIDQQALDQAGLTTDQLVTMNLSGLRLESALNLLLGPLDLDYVIRDEALVVTSNPVAGKYLETQLYDVRDVLSKVPAVKLEEIIQTVVAPDTWAREGGSGAIWALDSVLIVYQTQRNQRRVEEFLEKLRGAIAKPDAAQADSKPGL